MYIEDQLWIADALKVNLPDAYLIAIDNFPFLDHEGSTDLALWDDAEQVIKWTEKWRSGETAWPNEWVQIGLHKDGPYALNCKNGCVVLAKDGDIQNREFKYESIHLLVDDIHDGYRGKLPGSMARKDSSFKKFDFENKINWVASNEEDWFAPFEDRILFRVDQRSTDHLIEKLRSGGVYVITINGGQMNDEEAFYNELGRSIFPDNPGQVDWWPDVSSHLINKLEPEAHGGLLHVAIIWKSSDQTLADNPLMMMDAVAFFYDLDIFLDTGCFIDMFYLGSFENGYNMKIAENHLKK